MADLNGRIGKLEQQLPPRENPNVCQIRWLDHFRGWYRDQRTGDITRGEPGCSKCHGKAGSLGGIHDIVFYLPDLPVYEPVFPVWWTPSMADEAGG